MQFREICSGQPHGETRVWQLQTPRVPALLEQLSTKFLRKSMSGRAVPDMHDGLPTSGSAYGFFLEGLASQARTAASHFETTSRGKRAVYACIWTAVRNWARREEPVEISR